MAGRAATSSAKWAREFLLRRNPLGAIRNSSSAAPGAASSTPKVPHFSKKVSTFGSISCLKKSIFLGCLLEFVSSNAYIVIYCAVDLDHFWLLQDQISFSVLKV